MAEEEEFQRHMRAIRLGAKLRKKRQACGFSLEQVAEILHSAKASLSGLENGNTTKPDAFLLIGLAELYGIAPDEFFQLFQQEESHRQLPKR